MLQAIRAADRYHYENDWLSTYWHFSFDHYIDPANTRWGALRVFNDDTIRPHSGFPTHPHRDMEIVTYVLEGELTHRDSAGHRGVIGPGEVQRMTAGRGIEHSEFNAGDVPVHLLQIWILPERRDLPPSWEQRRFPRPADRPNSWIRLVGPAPLDTQEVEPLRIHQDASIQVCALQEGARLEYALAPGRYGYLFVIRGAVTVNGTALGAGDQGRIAPQDGGASLDLAGREASELMLLDLP